ncbi:hypothetical protein [Neobacillus drentensis]|nr:hypothetical protein [Neobacillus drentensis]
MAFLGVPKVTYPFGIDQVTGDGKKNILNWGIQCVFRSFSNEKGILL